MTLPWNAIARWYRAHGRDLPWRRTSDPYRIAVSEFMLQQTQVDRVVPLFKKFISAFPSWKALSEASQADVVRAWKGLGYNLRAVRLRAMAQEIAALHQGRLPETAETLLSIKGIGPYTARALRVFAFRKRALAPDTNVRRVLNRLFKGPHADPKVMDERAWTRWEATLPPRLSYEVNQGLMDIGATVCKAGKPTCPDCPLKTFCASYPRILKMKALPKQKAPRRERVDAHGIPNRIYRGRVIEALRERPWPTAQIDSLGQRVRPSYAAAERSWLLGVLSGLERDGLVRKSGTRWVLA